MCLLLETETEVEVLGRVNAIQRKNQIATAFFCKDINFNVVHLHLSPLALTCYTYPSASKWHFPNPKYS